MKPRRCGRKRAFFGDRDEILELLDVHRAEATCPKDVRSAVAPLSHWPRASLTEAPACRRNAIERAGPGGCPKESKITRRFPRRIATCRGLGLHDILPRLFRRSVSAPTFLRPRFIRKHRWRGAWLGANVRSHNAARAI